MIPAFVNYAHRGASEYCPENTLLSFYTGVYMGANGIETDVRRSRDGVLFLFHDGTMERMLHDTHAIEDYTAAELREMIVSRNGLSDRLTTLEDLLAHFAFRDLTFAIELKQPHIEQQVVDMLRRYRLQEKIVITSFDFDHIARVRQLAPEFDTGFLTREVDDVLLREMKKIGCTELCPAAALTSADAVQAWKAKGFRVRAWGVKNETLMRQAYESGVDGMTVNFPDKLQALLRKNPG